MINEILNHLWQSTAFAAAVAMACVALRRNSPRLRYWLWLAASMKFLVPFSLLVSMGARVQFPPDTPSLHAVTVQQISTYFAPVSALRAAAPAHVAFPWPVVLGAIWILGALFLLFRWFRRWRVMNLAARNATQLQLDCAVPVFSSSGTMEPGTFGIFRPVILLPDGIVDNLTPGQFEAVIAHELRHIRYRDNLTAALQMCVETLFWFHPAVWWIGAKLMDERERDCDEAVLRQGSRPGDYARSIVQVCETYTESPLACATGIGGSDLKKRIREIMTWRGSMPMTFRGKLALTAVTISAISVPFVIGVVRAQTLPPPPANSYEVVSIHPSGPGQTGRAGFSPGPHGGLQSRNTSVMDMLTWAYQIPDYRFVGAPGWTQSDHFDITLTPDKVEVAIGPETPMKELLAGIGRNQQRLLSVLRDRFGLIMRAETRELSIYALTQARGGANLSLDPAPGVSTSFRRTAPGRIEAVGAPIKMLANYLSMDLGRPVNDETGMTGQYDLKLEWTPEPAPSSDPALAGASGPAAGPSIFTALTEQLGLRLEPKKGPVQVYVIETIERPTEN